MPLVGLRGTGCSEVEMGTDESERKEVEGCAGNPGGGRYVMIRLAIQNAVIADASYRCNGCAYAHQLGRGLTDFLKGRSLGQASKIEPQDVLAIAGPIPEGKEYYAKMAAEALQNAISSANSAAPRDISQHSALSPQHSEAP